MGYELSPEKNFGKKSGSQNRRRERNIYSYIRDISGHFQYFFAGKVLGKMCTSNNHLTKKLLMAATPTCFLWKLVSFEFWFHQPKIDTYSSISHALKSLLIYNSKITLQNFFMLSPKLPYLYHTFFFSLFFYQYKCQIFTFFPFPPFFLSYKSHNIVFEFFYFFGKRHNSYENLETY